MPSSTDILDQLALAATELGGLAIAWHVAIGLVAIGMIRGWKPPARIAGPLMIGLPFSVSLVAVRYGAWFNAISFGALALAMTLATAQIDKRWRARGSAWTRLLGIALVGFGFVYPHFVEGSWYRALYAAPIGVVPCPTLAVLAGFTLLTGGHESRAIPAVLATWTAFYGLFGMFVLGVGIDAGLVVGATGLALVTIHNARGGLTMQPRAFHRP